MLDIPLGLAGAVVGGVAGYYLFAWIVGQGLYALALPGALLGWGCGALSGRKSVPLGVTCGALGLLLGVFTEWRTAPFVTDGSLSFFLAHLHKLSVVTQALILVGAACGYWFGLGREGGAWPRRQNL